jgi:hypothetical protein
VTIHISFDLIGRIVVWIICLLPLVWVLLLVLIGYEFSGLWPWDHWGWVNRIQRRRYERKHGKPRAW